MVNPTTPINSGSSSSAVVQQNSPLLQMPVELVTKILLDSDLNVQDLGASALR